MNAYAVSSIILAFFATAGAIPMLRVLPQVLRSGALGEPLPVPDTAHPRVAGPGVFFGIFIASFYLLDPTPAAAGGLVLGALLLIVIGSVAEEVGPRPARPWRAFAAGTVGTVVAGVFALEYLDYYRTGWTIGFFVVLIAALLTPLAMARMANRAGASAAAPTAIGLIEVLSLLLFGALSAVDRSRYALADEFLVVALPAVGSLVAALIYQLPMPWRRQALVATGIGGSLALGLLIAWGVLRLGPATARSYGGMSALLWLIAVPLFELVLDAVRFWYVRFGGRLDLPGRPIRRVSLRLHSLPYLCTSAVVMSSIGLVLWHLEIVGALSAFLLLPAFAVYLLVPQVLAAFPIGRGLATSALDQAAGASNRQAS
ncbi:MAG: hypothetical protein AB7P21_30640 [Lautropia sp.]